MRELSSNKESHLRVLSSGVNTNGDGRTSSSSLFQKSSHLEKSPQELLTWTSSSLAKNTLPKMGDQTASVANARPTGACVKGVKRARSEINVSVDSRFKSSHFVASANGFSADVKSDSSDPDIFPRNDVAVRLGRSMLQRLKSPKIQRTSHETNHMSRTLSQHSVLKQNRISSSSLISSRLGFCGGANKSSSRMVVLPRSSSSQPFRAIAGTRNSETPSMLSSTTTRKSMPSISPVDFLENLIKETTAPEMDIKQIIQPSHSITNFFLNPTEKDLKSYSSPVIQATRAGDIPALRTLADSGVSLQCCNKFGESLIHLTCRRGLDHVAEFLLREAKVMARVKDDYGRTPMHDACWTTKPNFRLMRLLIQEEPRLLFLSDRRSHTPLNYIRREHWSVWVSFLESIKDDLIATIAMIHIENINKI